MQRCRAVASRGTRRVVFPDQSAAPATKLTEGQACGTAAAHM